MFVPTILTAAGQLGAQASALREMARTSPAKDSSGQAAEKLGQAALNRMQKLGIDSDRSKVIRLNASTPESTQAAMKNPLMQASYQRLRNLNTGEHAGGQVNINTNAARDIFAHELGHHISDNTKIGNMIANLRHNPRTAMALGAGVFGLPFLQSALQEGDDDIASGIAIASLMAAPTLVDEALATKNAFAIMKDADMPATLGQRGRLAGAYLGYAAGPIISGLAGGGLGNVADDYTAVYNLGNDQTSGTLMP